jgi:hypothetical protein
MYKKITGMETHGETVRDSLKNARAAHDAFVAHFNNKKAEYGDIKKENEVARAVLKKEE